MGQTDLERTTIAELRKQGGVVGRVVIVGYIGFVIVGEYVCGVFAIQLFSTTGRMVSDHLSNLSDHNIVLVADSDRLKRKHQRRLREIAQHFNQLNW